MEALFGARKTPAERIKEYNRSIKKCAAAEPSLLARSPKRFHTTRGMGWHAGQRTRAQRLAAVHTAGHCARGCLPLQAAQAPCARHPTRAHVRPSRILTLRSVREIDRERMGLERQEKKLIADIKKAAKDGQLDSAKVMAKDLVRTRGYVKKM
jgi:hypothetical protein